MSEKIAMMESLLVLLAHLFGMSTTQIAEILLSEGIRSWSDFEREVRRGRGYV